MRLEGLPMKNVTKIISPAKVNLVLAVGEKRENGFHEVQTIMHSLALHDTLLCVVLTTRARGRVFR